MLNLRLLLSDIGGQILLGCLMLNGRNLADGTWYGPDPVLVWGRGTVCVFPQDADNPIWVPERLVHAVDFPVQKPEDRTEPRDQTDTSLSTEELLIS